MKHFSKTAIGKREETCHEQIRHRQMMQVNWDIYIRDPQVYRSKAREILGPHAKLWMPKPARELDPHRGQNCRGCGNMIEGLRIVNEDGECFWILLFNGVASHYSDLKTRQLNNLVMMWMRRNMHCTAICMAPHRQTRSQDHGASA